jgi:hypothetical protein
MDTGPFMMEPPANQDRWEAGSRATVQIILGACLFTLGTVVYGLRILTRVRLQKNALRLDDREFYPSVTGDSTQANYYQSLLALR